MFCSKCGQKCLDDAAFCRKCGTPMANGNALQQPVADPVPAESSPPPAKKKSKKLLIGIAGVIGLIIIIAVIGAIMDDNDAPTVSQSGQQQQRLHNNPYVRAVQSGYFLDYTDTTIGEAFNNFFGNPSWEHTDLAGMPMVEFEGIAELDGEEVTVHIQFMFEDDVTDDGDVEFYLSAFLIDNTPILDHYYESLVAAIFGVSQEEAKAAEEIDTSDWVSVADENGEFTLSIPASWNYGHEEWGGISIFGEDNGVELLFEAHTMNLDPFEYEGSKDESLSWDHFLFNDGHSGYVMIFPHFTTWSNNTMPRHIHLTLHHGGDMSVFTDNEILISRIARSLTSALPNETAQESAASANQSSGGATVNEVLYNGIPVLSFLDSSIYALRDLSNVFGNPTGSVVEDIMQTYFNEVANWGEFLGYREIFIWDLSALTVNGVSLDKDRNELINILGTPIYDGIHEDAGGNETWRLQYKDMTFIFTSPANKAHGFALKAKV